MFRFTIRDLLWLMVAAALVASWFCEHRAREIDLARLSALQGEHDKLQETHNAQKRQLIRSGFVWVQTGGKWYIVGNPAPQDPADAAAIMKVLKDENELQKKLIERLKPERQEIRDKSEG